MLTYFPVFSMMQARKTYCIYPTENELQNSKDVEMVAGWSSGEGALGISVLLKLISLIFPYLNFHFSSALLVLVSLCSFSFFLSLIFYFHWNLGREIRLDPRFNRIYGAVALLYGNVAHFLSTVTHYICCLNTIAQPKAQIFCIQLVLCFFWSLCKACCK